MWMICMDKYGDASLKADRIVYEKAIQKGYAPKETPNNYGR